MATLLTIAGAKAHQLLKDIVAEVDKQTLRPEAIGDSKEIQISQEIPTSKRIDRQVLCGVATFQTTLLLRVTICLLTWFKCSVILYFHVCTGLN